MIIVRLFFFLESKEMLPIRLGFFLLPIEKYYKKMFEILAMNVLRYFRVSTVGINLVRSRP